VGGLVVGEQADFDEGAGVEQALEPLARGEFAGGVLLGDFVGAAHLEVLRFAGAQIFSKLV